MPIWLIKLRATFITTFVDKIIYFLYVSVFPPNMGTYYSLKLIIFQWDVLT